MIRKKSRARSGFLAVRKPAKELCWLSARSIITVHFGNTKLKKILDNILADVAQRQSNSMVNSFAHSNRNIRMNPELRLKT